MKHITVDFHERGAPRATTKFKTIFWILRASEKQAPEPRDATLPPLR